MRAELHPDLERVIICRICSKRFKGERTATIHAMNHERKAHKALGPKRRRKA